MWLINITVCKQSDKVKDCNQCRFSSKATTTYEQNASNAKRWLNLISFLWYSFEATKTFCWSLRVYFVVYVYFGVMSCVDRGTSFFKAWRVSRFKGITDKDSVIVVVAFPPCVFMPLYQQLSELAAPCFLSVLFSWIEHLRKASNIHFESGLD